MNHAALPGCLIVLLLLAAAGFTARAQVSEPAQAAPLAPATQPAQALPVAQLPATKPEGVYFVACRTKNHINASSPEVFHKVADDLIAYLRSRDVNIIEDPERGILQSSEVFSSESLQNLTKNAGASFLVLATIDRPMSKWLKVSVQAYDLSGKVLWAEEASSGSGFSGAGAPEKVLKTLTAKIDPRIGSPGLPRRGPQPPAASPPRPSAEKPSGTAPSPKQDLRDYQ